jgi:hypothetical protein
MEEKELLIKYLNNRGNRIILFNLIQKLSMRVCWGYNPTLEQLSKQNTVQKIIRESCKDIEDKEGIKISRTVRKEIATNIGNYIYSSLN